MYLLYLGSSGSIQSWASSLSADSQSEEAAVEFMKMFVPKLFETPVSINQEEKANFGQMVLVSKTLLMWLFFYYSAMNYYSWFRQNQYTSSCKSANLVKALMIML